jgi:hypothetical protein
MRIGTLVLVVAFLGLPACSQHGAPATSPKVVIDTADRAAFTALRAFQTAEEAAYHSRLPWPTPAQHITVNGKVSQGYALIISVANLGIALPPGASLSLADLAVIGQLTQVVADIVALTRTADPATQAAATATQTQVTALTAAVQGGK